MGIRQKDIARHAGVSPATVSRVLNNAPGVDEALVQKVYAAMEALGYTPEPSTKAMRDDTSLIAILGWKGFLTDIYYSFMYNGMLKTANEHNFGLVISDWTAENRGYREQILGEGGAEGIIGIIPSREEEEIIYTAAQQRGVPVCILDRYTSTPGLSYVTAAHAAAARVAVEHLLARGHRRIAHITTAVDTQIVRLRQQSYLDALCAAGIEPVAPYLVQIRPTSDAWFTEEHGAAGVEQLLNLKTPPTAVFAVNDRVAFGVLEVLAARGVRVPGEIAVIGIDDHPSARMAYGGLTTVDTQKARVGNVATLLLMESIEAGTPAHFQVELPPRLVVRATTGG